MRSGAAPTLYPNRVAALLADADLAELARLWPSLPPTVRTEIMALAARSVPSIDRPAGGGGRVMKTAKPRTCGCKAAPGPIGRPAGGADTRIPPQTLTKGRPAHAPVGSVQRRLCRRAGQN